MGDRADLMTTRTTSSIGIARRRRVGGVGLDDGLCGVEANNLWGNFVVKFQL
jgi:hypothetical protein